VAEVLAEAEVLAADVPAAEAQPLGGKRENYCKKKIKMKKSTIIFLAVTVLVVLWFIWIYNGLVSAEEKVNKQWANVESQYQRRADLIPNLVATVKGYAAHESTTLENVVAARSKATQMTVDAESLTPEKLKEYQAAQGELSSALGRLLMLTENYPDLKANQNFLELQAQLEGTENRIQVERSRYNEVAGNYNTLIRRFPKNLIASLTGLERKPYFEADEEAKKAPKVEF
jgi:LemA protein